MSMMNLEDLVNTFNAKCIKTKCIKNELKQYARKTWPAHIQTPNAANVANVANAANVARQKIANATEYASLLELGRTTSLIMSELIGHVNENKFEWRLHDVDEMFMRMCIKNRVYPGCLGYKKYPKSMCTNPDDVVAHGLPLWNKKLDDVGILGLDMVTYKNGLYVDIARTINIANANANDSRHLCRVTHAAAIAAIDACKPGVPIGVVAAIFDKHAKEHGYSVAHGLNSHFILNTLHGETIPNGWSGINHTKVFEEGMVFAIEPIFNAGSPDIIKRHTGYFTVDGLPSAHFEHTVVIDHGKAVVIA
jgi:methionyl aminopeptidase